MFVSLFSNILDLLFKLNFFFSFLSPTSALYPLSTTATSEKLMLEVLTNIWSKIDFQTFQRQIKILNQSMQEGTGSNLLSAHSS